MKDRKYNNARALDSEEHRVWEPAHANTANIAVHDGKSFGVCGGECDGAIDLLDEGSTETGAAFFVPDCGFIEFMARRRSEANLKRHLSMRLVIDAFTSFQGTTS
jgi:hypothetical protein